ncbi:MAG: PAS domain S-box protein [Deltaproteobacteria bacterium]|nr:PAS domain S-box protein [Deltaproteobacteria bacterium]
MNIIEFELPAFGRMAASKLRETPQVSDIINSLSQPIIALDRRLHVTAINKAFHEAFFLWTGVRLYLGMNYLEVLPKEVVPERLTFYRRAFSGEGFSLEQDYNLAGEIHTFLVTYDPIYSGGEVIGIIGSAKDITEQKLIEKSLREANLKFENSFRFNSVGMALIEPTGQFLKANATLCKMLGYSEEEMKTKSFPMITHPEDLEKSFDIFQRLVKGELEWAHIEKRYLHKSGKVIQAILSSSFVREEDGTPLYFISVVQDISERKRAEDELLNSERRVVNMMKVAPVGIYQTDVERDCIYVNDRWCELTGLSSQEVTGNSWIKSVYQEDVRDVEQELKRCQESKDVFSLEYRLRKSTGEITWVHGREIPLRDEKGALVGYMGAIQDISKIKEAEKVRERLIYILDATPDIVGIFDIHGKSIYLNEAAREVLGLDADDLDVGQTSWEMYPTWAEELIRNQGIPAASRDGFWKGETSIIHHDGREIPLSQIILAHKNKDGVVEYFSTIGRDMSRQKEFMAELARSNTELEQFAYVASHDLQEPLRMIVSYLQFLDLEYREQLSPEADEYLHFAVNGAKRMSRLIKDLLTYSKVGRSEFKTKSVDCGAILDVVQEQLRTMIQQAEGLVEVGPLPTVNADESQLMRLFQNLMENAIKYRGKISPKVKVSAHQQSGKWVFCVSDNGRGFEMKDVNRIFRLFQRLHDREEYPGSGIGLAIAKSIVERHGGKIWAESKVNEGSNFYFTLSDCMAAEKELVR